MLISGKTKDGTVIINTTCIAMVIQRTGFFGDYLEIYSKQGMPFDAMINETLEGLQQMLKWSNKFVPLTSVNGERTLYDLDSIGFIHATEYGTEIKLQSGQGCSEFFQESVDDIEKAIQRAHQRYYNEG